MRVNNTGGIPPSDRRIDRRKVAIAAVAALFLFATSTAQAVPTEFVVIPGLSSTTTGQELGPVGSTVAFTPQFPGSATTSLSGSIFADIDTPGFITMATGLSGGIQTLAIGAPGFGGVPGAYNPAQPAVGVYPGGVSVDANFGTVWGAFGIATAASVTDLTWDWFSTHVGARALGVGGEFDYFPGEDLLVALSGRQVSSSTLPDLNSDDDLSGDPVAGFGLASLAKPSWDPLDLTAGPLGTLTLPIASFSSQIIEDTPFGDLELIITNFGVIVATPVPEPSSLALLGVGVVGLLAFGRRLRRRRA